MRSIKSQILSTVGAAVIILGTAVPAFATGWSSPDLVDVNNAVSNISAECIQVTALPVTLAKDNIKVVYLEDILNPDQVTIIKDSLNNPASQANILALQNVLNLKSVLSGINVLSCAQFLNNNSASLKDVVGVEILNGSQLIVFCCH